MNGSLRRALCAAAGALALTAGAAHASAPVFEPIALSLPELSYGPVPDARPAPADGATSVALLDGIALEVGGKVDLAGRIAPVDMSNAHAFDGLFISASSSGVPYAALAGGGNFFGAAATLSKNLRVSAGLQSVVAGASTYAPNATTAAVRLAEPAPFAQRSADALIAGVSWDASKWASFGLTASNVMERDGILGNAAPGATANTTALGLSARVRLGGGWSTTASFSEGISQLDVKAGVAPAFGPADSLRTHAYGIAIAKNGLFGDDALGVAVSRPALGQGEFVVMPGNAGAAPSFFARNHLLEQIGAAQETDVEIGYVTSFLDGSLALQTNASFQMNYAGQNGANAVSLLSRARIKF
ncbi:MAG: hypothetical protein WDN01_21835 [Rhizomicrobium sp.]